jgi:hypothetical protein
MIESFETFESTKNLGRKFGLVDPMTREEYHDAIFEIKMKFDNDPEVTKALKILKDKANEYLNVLDQTTEEYEIARDQYYDDLGEVDTNELSLFDYIWFIDLD